MCWLRGVARAPKSVACALPVMLRTLLLIRQASNTCRTQKQPGPSGGPSAGLGSRNRACRVAPLPRGLLHCMISTQITAVISNSNPMYGITRGRQLPQSQHAQCQPGHIGPKLPHIMWCTLLWQAAKRDMHQPARYPPQPDTHQSDQDSPQPPCPIVTAVTARSTPARPRAPRWRLRTRG